MPSEHEAADTTDFPAIVIRGFGDLVHETMSRANVVEAAEFLLHRLQSLPEHLDLSAVQEAFEEFDGIAQLLECDAKPVPLHQRHGLESFAALPDWAPAMRNKAGGKAPDRRKEQSGLPRHRLVAPAACLQPSAKLQHRSGISPRPDRLLGMLVGRLPLL